MAVQAVLDGVDITSITLEGSVTQRLNRPAIATVKVPSDLTSGNDRSRLKVYVDGQLDFHGTVEHIEDDGDEDTMYTVFTAADPTIIFEARYARDADGDYSKPSFIQDFVTGPPIVEAIVQNSIDQVGEMGIVLGTFATGGADLRGTPTNWPMTIADVISLLTDTGELDVVCRPIEAGGNMGELSAYNGNYGVDRTGSVVFEYRTGSCNVRACRRTVDKRDLRNRIRFLLGPRVGTAADPAGDQHWRASIDRTSTGLLPDPPQSTIEAARAQSELDYYVREQIREYDALGSNNPETVAAVFNLYLRLWQLSAWLQLKPRTEVHLTPQRGIAPAFGPGDLISVAAGPGFRGGFSGVQRVMERTYRWDENGVIELGEPVGMAGAAAVVATADNEGLP